MTDPLNNTPDEIWKPIPGYEGIYSVSNFGRIRREAGVQCSKERVLHPEIRRSGYVQACLYSHCKRKRFLVHRLVAKAFIPFIFGKPDINHKDGIKTHNWASNLEWCTPQENMDHRINVLGKSNRGEKSGRAKLTEETVREVRRLAQSGQTLRQIARQFGVCHAVIGCTVRRVTWKDVI